ncbi:UPF0481 protein At3g47200-like [Rhodamnia argentea]|uniref:UPF0481 protein At3g47200-like n=1 Tax=Rhodamnia argentea TaxID=178133 RepID=A0A8B8PHE9_9MYRT|nr:UPF0481 protein At3g47200-like [Rhodamnia argentea]
MAGARQNFAVGRHRHQPAGGNHHNQLVTYLRSKLESLSAESEDRCIHAVPYKIRKTHREAFAPKHFCIGPFHRGKQSKTMEKHKLRYLESFLGQQPNRLEECLAAIQKLEDRTRQCYSEKIDLDSGDFVTMVLVDGAFIDELFLLNHFPKRRAANDIIFDPQKKVMIAEVRRDLSLMENQLPFFVLKDLFGFAAGTQSGELPSLLKLAYDFFKVGANLTEEWDRISERDVKHLLDALRSWYLPTEKVARVSPSKRIEPMPRAKQLRAAGVKFKKSESNCLFEIKFSRGGELEIPCLELFPEIESFLRNVMAFERSCYGDDSYFIDYVAFLGNLIDTRADAKLMIKKKIIHIGDWSGHDETVTGNDEALANLFNSFGNESRFRTKNAGFCTLRHELKTYRRTPLHKLKFSIKGNSVSKKKHQV